MTHVKTKLFFGPLLTYLFIHYNVPLESESSLPIRTKLIDSVAIEKMERALERSKTLKSVQPSSSQAPTLEEESSEESDDGGVSKEQFETLRNELNSLSTGFQEYKVESSQRFDRIDERIDQCSAKIDHCHEEIMSYLRGRFPPPFDT